MGTERRDAPRVRNTRDIRSRRAQTRPVLGLPSDCRETAEGWLTIQWGGMAVPWSVWVVLESLYRGLILERQVNDLSKLLEHSQRIHQPQATSTSMTSQPPPVLFPPNVTSISIPHLEAHHIHPSNQIRFGLILARETVVTVSSGSLGSRSGSPSEHDPSI